MNSIELMVNEHKNILRMLDVVRKACFLVLKGEEICYEDFNSMVDFIRNYADNHHHGKEEKFLFNEMQNHLGDLANKLIKHGMLIEHDYGRMYIKELVDALERVKDGDEESKLDVISNAISYTHLLKRHIAKEDDGVYKFAENNLPKEILEDVNNKTELYEKQENEKGTQKYYIELLEKLEKKYLL
jgi:hemerythrin-like domain-containing protein